MPKTPGRSPAARRASPARARRAATDAATAEPERAASNERKVKEHHANPWATVAATLASMILGVLWYGPLFRAKWAALVGVGAGDDPSMWYSPVAQLAVTFVQANVHEHALQFASAYLHSYGWQAGVASGVSNWFLLLPALVGPQLWAGKPWPLFAIDGGFYLCSLLAQGVILATWPRGGPKR
jgi:hypothetical protein